MNALRERTRFLRFAGFTDVEADKVARYLSPDWYQDSQLWTACRKAGVRITAERKADILEQIKVNAEINAEHAAERRMGA